MFLGANLRSAQDHVTAPTFTPVCGKTNEAFTFEIEAHFDSRIMSMSDNPLNWGVRGETMRDLLTRRESCASR